MSVPDSHADLLERAVFSHLATIRPDGSPQSSVMWFEWDGSLLRFTHTKGRQKFRNLAEETRVALSIHDPEDPYRSLEVRGLVDSIDTDTTGEFFNRLAERYGSEFRVHNPDDRVIIGIRPTTFIATVNGEVVKPS